MQISQRKRSQVVLGAYSDQRAPPGTHRKGFSDRKRPKEGERVARRHFHEREKNFGTSGYKIRRFVSEIWPFEVGIAVQTNSTCEI